MGLMVNEPGIGQVFLYLILGAIAAAGGIAAILFRKPIFKLISAEQKKLIGRSAGEAISRLQRPFGVAVAGVIIAGIGVTMMVLGIMLIIRLAA